MKENLGLTKRWRMVYFCNGRDCVEFDKRDS